jgi:hypothetical protein
MKHTEPLKNKTYVAHGIAGAIQFQIANSEYKTIKKKLNRKYHRDKDIIAALEWAKEQFVERCEIKKFRILKTLKDVLNDAFPDLYEENQK